jgi:hypothetical protein
MWGRSRITLPSAKPSSMHLTALALSVEGTDRRIILSSKIADLTFRSVLKHYYRLVLILLVWSLADFISTACGMWEINEWDLHQFKYYHLFSTFGSGILS